MKYRVIRSNRKTIAIQVGKEGVVVRAPYRVPDGEIERFVSEHGKWIQKQQEKLALELSGQPAVERLTTQDIQKLADQALKVIPERVRYYAPLVGVTYGRITIRNQKSRWGSCSSKGNLNFNCLLMLTPPEVIDSVVVHELCHRKEMNHSKAFYEEIYRVYPDYDKWNRWLKENGSALMRRMTG
ncbi:MAG: M48 family metallopeptidase [Lachnospiraceae bacterium]|nr:M48 family metallopeptidase [Lachnospiraceae bacterium]